MAITNPYYKDWVENEKKEWEEIFRDDFIEVEGGLCSLNGKRTSYWDETLFLGAIPYFTTDPTPYLYTYRYDNGTYGTLISFFEFKHVQKHFRLSIGESSDMLNFSVSIKIGDDYYDFGDSAGEHRSILLSLYEILNNLANFIVNLPNHRLKIITGGLTVIRSQIDNLPIFFDKIL